MKSLDGAAEPIVDEWTTDDLVVAVKAAGEWTEGRLQSADFVLRNWTAQVGARHDEDSIIDLEATIARVADLLPPPDAYLARWRGFHDVLESRRLTLATQDPARVAKQRHVGRILACLSEHGPTRQGDLLQTLNLGISESRLSQIVALVEANGLIEVERKGRERMLSVSEVGRKVIVEAGVNAEPVEVPAARAEQPKARPAFVPASTPVGSAAVFDRAQVEPAAA